MGEGFRSRNVHGRRKGVVGGLCSIDVVVGVDGGLGAHFASSDFNRSICDDLIGVHVGLSAASSLPDTKREVVVEVAVTHFLGSSYDEVSHFWIQLFQGDICLRCRLFQHAKSPDDSRGHGVVPDVEVEERASGLTAVIAV